MATKVLTIRNLFNSQVFNHGNIQAITNNVFAYDIEITTDKDLNDLRYNQRINFFSYQALRSINYDITSMNGNGNDYGYIYEVQISYYLEAENESTAYNSCIDAMEKIEDTIHSELGLNWDGNVSLFRQEANGLPEIVTIQNIECWKMTSLYTGYLYN